MELTKHGFIDEYPYLVYTDEQTIVYSDKADTSIDDILPSGTIEITENGEGIDVAQYAYADVNVSGGGGSTKYNVKCYEMSGPDATEISSFVYQAEWSGTRWEAVGDSPVSEANAGDVLIIGSVEYQTITMTSTTDFQSADFCLYPLDANDWYFVMPQHDVCLLAPAS